MRNRADLRRISFGITGDLAGVSARKETDGGEAGTSTVRSSGITDMMQPDFEHARTSSSLLTVRLTTDAGSNW